jgi:hypothetical protein
MTGAEKVADDETRSSAPRRVEGALWGRPSVFRGLPGRWAEDDDRA